MSHRPGPPVLASSLPRPRARPGTFRPPAPATGLPAPCCAAGMIPPSACPARLALARMDPRPCPQRRKAPACVPGDLPDVFRPCPGLPPDRSALCPPPLLRRSGFAARPPRLRTGACAAAVPDARRGRSHTTGYGPALLRPPRRSDAHRGDRPQARASVLPRAPAPRGPAPPARGRPRPADSRQAQGRAQGRITGRSPGRRTAKLPGRCRRAFWEKHAIPRPLTARAGPPCPLSQYTDKLQKVFTAYLLLFCKNKLYLSKNISRYKVSAKLHINC